MICLVLNGFQYFGAEQDLFGGQVVRVNFGQRVKDFFFFLNDFFPNPPKAI